MPLNYTISDFSLRDVDYYMDRVPKTIIQKLDDEEYTELKNLIFSAIPKSSPKLIDIRFVINLIFVKYFFVLLVSKDHYKKRAVAAISPMAPRSQRSHPVVRIFYKLLAVTLLLITNLVISVLVVALFYIFTHFLGLQVLPVLN